LVFHDITQVGQNLRLKEQVEAANLTSSYMSHEMVTPLKCVSQLVDKVKTSKNIEPSNLRFLDVINSTIKLLLATTK
jgi:hypothetical protein